MGKTILSIIVAATAWGGSTAFGQDNLPEPTAEQVFAYVRVIEQMPATDMSEAEDVLNRWMAGELSTSRPEAALDEEGAGEFAACVAAACGFLGCNPVVLAACAALK